MSEAQARRLAAMLTEKQKAGLNLSRDLCRVLVVLDRLGKLD